MLIYEVPSREKNNSKSGAVRRKTNLLVRQILIGWIYRRIGFLKRGKKKQIKPLAVILRFLDFSIPRYRHFERSREIFLALCSFLLLSLKVSPFPLSHIRHYPLLPERSLGFARDDDTGIALSQHILYTMRGISPYDAKEKSPSQSWSFFVSVKLICQTVRAWCLQLLRYQ